MRGLVLKRLLVVAMLVVASGLSNASELTVAAAASLSNAFKEIAQRYESRYPGAKVLLSFGASGALLQQIAKGAPVDVFASADQETLDMAEKQGWVAGGTRRNFVQNTLVLIAPSDSKVSLMRLEDLARSDIQRVAMGNPASVPAGRYAKKALDAVRAWPALEAKIVGTQNVRQSLDYVARGEVDAGFVYASDVVIMKDKVKVMFQVPLDVAIRYPVAPIAGSSNNAEAERFIGFLLSAEGQSVLAKYGFQKP